MRTLFIGGTKRGYLTLRSLVDGGADIVGVFSMQQDAHEQDRYEQHIRELAEAHQIPLYETKFLKDRDYGSIAKELRPDVCFVVGCRVRIDKSVYEIPARGCLAVHDSLLPEYRGFAPINWSLINGEDHVGVSLFHLNETVDGGDLVSQERVQVDADDTAAEVYERVCSATIRLIRDAFPKIAAGTAPRTPQNPEAGSFTCARTPDDGLIDWSRPTLEIYNLIRALGRPYPGAFTYLRGRRLTIWGARPVIDGPIYVGRVPGRVVQRYPTEGSVDVLTGDGVLRIEVVESTGEDGPAPASSVLRSIRDTLGLHLTDLLASLHALHARYPDIQ